jgi:hypothetical protein
MESTRTRSAGDCRQRRACLVGWGKDTGDGARARGAVLTEKWSGRLMGSVMPCSSHFAQERAKAWRRLDPLQATALGCRCIYLLTEGPYSRGMRPVTIPSPPRLGRQSIAVHTPRPRWMHGEPQQNSNKRIPSLYHRLGFHSSSSRDGSTARVRQTSKLGEWNRAQGYLLVITLNSALSLSLGSRLCA